MKSDILVSKEFCHYQVKITIKMSVQVSRNFSQAVCTCVGVRSWSGTCASAFVVALLFVVGNVATFILMGTGKHGNLEQTIPV